MEKFMMLISDRTAHKSWHAETIAKLNDGRSLMAQSSTSNQITISPTRASLPTTIGTRLQENISLRPLIAQTVKSKATTNTLLTTTTACGSGPEETMRSQGHPTLSLRKLKSIAMPSVLWLGSPVGFTLAPTPAIVHTSWGLDPMGISTCTMPPTESIHCSLSSPLTPWAYSRARSSAMTATISWLAIRMVQSTFIRGSALGAHLARTLTRPHAANAPKPW